MSVVLAVNRELAVRAFQRELARMAHAGARRERQTGLGHLRLFAMETMQGGDLGIIFR